ncbi:hypothetical protein SDC9_98591 [bioreactor metagenome]|uniref:Uncharacterized protein n=1 Tax=bioreactor metagenome TaxID=1076179 RepID=A0A645AFA4_9ZZZZ
MGFAEILPNPPGGVVDEPQFADRNDEDIEIDLRHHRHRRLLVDGETAEQRLRKRQRNENHIVGVAQIGILRTAMILQNTDDPVALGVDFEQTADDVGPAQGKQFALGLAADHADRQLGVRIGRRQPAAGRHHRTAVGQKFRRDRDHLDIETGGALEHILADIADHGHPGDIVHFDEIVQILGGKTVAFGILNPAAGLGFDPARRRLLPVNDDFINPHRLNLFERGTLRPLGNRQHGDHAADAENDPQRSQDRPHLVQHDIVHGKPEGIGDEHHFTGCTPVW